MKKIRPLFICICLALLSQAPFAWGKTRNVVTEYGADNTGVKYATVNIQNAIDACLPGDVLLIPDGIYLLNDGLDLKSDMTVILSKNALLQANTLHDWVRNRSHIMNGENVKNVTITGGGKIDGGGLVYPRGDYNRPRPGRGIRFFKSENITIKQVKVYNIPNFAVDVVNSKDIVVDAVTIRGRGFFNLKGSADGLDIEGCSNVSVTDCNIEVGDDALCIKTSYEDPEYPCNNIRVRKCVLASTCNAFKIGTGTLADVYDVIAEDIIVNKHADPGTGNPVPTGDCIAAIAIESNDRHRVHHIICRNFTINSCYSPVYFDLQNRKNNNPPGVMGQLDNVLLENINCIKSVSQPIIFNWQCGGANKIKDITFKNVTIHNYGTEAGANLTCMDGNYPDANKNGIANAYGIWARGLDGLQLINCKFYDDGGSKREKFVFDGSVQNVNTKAATDSLTRVNYQQLLHSLAIQFPTLPPAAEDVNRPANTTPRSGSSTSYTDPQGRSYTRSQWGAWVNYDENKANDYTLPDPLVLKSGKLVIDAKTWWKQRRPEIINDYESEVFGTVPKNTPKVTFESGDADTVLHGTAIKKTITGHIDNTAYPIAQPAIKMVLYLPANATGPVPLMVIASSNTNGNSQTIQLLISTGWAVAIFDTNAVQADNGAGLDGGIIGLMSRGKPRKPRDWGVLRAWSWGLSRALDYFQTDKTINPKQIGLQGHSRWGKTALLAGAMDSRWAIIFASCSGSMGASLEKRNYGENIGIVAGESEYHWMAPNFVKYGGNWQALPVDAHDIMALIAPRPLFITGGTQDLWADPLGEFKACVAATPVFKLLGKTGISATAFPAPDVSLTDGDLAFRNHEGGHTDAPDWQVFIAFAKKYFK